MAGPESARWRPPSSRRSISYYRWTAWARLGLAVLAVALVVGGVVRGTSDVVGSVLFLFVPLFIGSTAIWTLQGIHALRQESRTPDDPADG